jgi:hypothetical protein
MELMVVVTIMAALVALSASAVLKFIEVQQTSNTQSTLDRVQSQLIKAWSKVKDSAAKESIPASIMGNPALVGTDVNAPERARVIYMKLRLRQAFPMTFNEALNPAPLPPLPGYTSYLGNLGILGSSPTTAYIESSACLLMALQRGVSGAGIDASDLMSGGAAGSSITPTGGNLPYLNDGWGRPIFFTRVPSGSLYLNPTGTPLAGANDPGDPIGYLNTPQWVQTCGTGFTQLTLQPVSPSASFKLAPMVGSGGPFNWTKAGAPTLNPVTFAPVPGAGALFSTP